MEVYKGKGAISIKAIPPTFSNIATSQSSSNSSPGNEQIDTVSSYLH